MTSTLGLPLTTAAPAIKEKRADKLPPYLTAFASSKISAACSCLSIAPSTTTVKSAATVTASASVNSPLYTPLLHTPANANPLDRHCNNHLNIHHNFDIHSPRRSIPMSSHSHHSQPCSPLPSRRSSHCRNGPRSTLEIPNQQRARLLQCMLSRYQQLCRLFLWGK